MLSGVIDVDIRKDAKELGEVFRMLSKTEEGRSALLELSKIRENGMEMLRHEDLLKTVIKIEEGPLECTFTLAHCLVLSGYEDVRLALSKMPANILELKTGDGDKVVELLIGCGSKVREALAENVDALKITCLDLLSDSGQMKVFGFKFGAIDPAMAKSVKGNSVAHLLLGGNPSDTVLRKIAVAPKEVLELVNGRGESVEYLLKEKIGLLYKSKSFN